jgi:DNA-binding FadR family transcriptional regulator
MLTKLHRETLAEKAATGLMEFIRARNLQPGDALPSEGALVVEFGVSRQVIREALKSLQGKGIIEIVNGKGALVRAIDSKPLLVFFQQAVYMNRDTLIELLEVRKGIEVQSATLAAQRRTPEDIHQMREIITKMRQDLYHPDAYVQLDLAFHLSIASATHNVMLLHLLESLQEVSKAMIREGLRHRQTAQQLERVQELHEAVFEEIARGDAEKAAYLMALQLEEPKAFINEDRGDKEIS